MGDIKDYKFHCFGGVVKLIQVDIDWFTEHKRNLYTPDWGLIDAYYVYLPNTSLTIERPKA